MTTPIDHNTFALIFGKWDPLPFVRARGGHKESRSSHSHEYILDCPHCGGDRCRWHHSQAKQCWQCWHCGRTGSSLSLVALHTGKREMDVISDIWDSWDGGDLEFDVDHLEAQSQVVVPDGYPSTSWPSGVALLDPNNGAHRVGVNYLLYRGLTLDQARDWRIGFGTMGRLKNYLLFPVFMGGRLVYWQARACWDPPPQLTKEQRKHWVKETRYRKTLNPFNDECGVVAADVLFNFDVARNYNHIVVCEGPVDAIKVGAHAVALFGKAYTEQKVAWLMRTRATRITLYLDHETVKETRRFGAALSAAADVFVAVPPEGRDAGDLTPAENAEVVSRAQPFDHHDVLDEL